MTNCRAIPTSLAILAPTAISLCLLVVDVRPANAHEFKLESLMNAFAKVEPQELHLVIRLPLHVTKTIPFPTKGAEIDLARAGPATDRVVEAVGHDVMLWEDQRLLIPKSAVGRLSLPSDRSFDSYPDAVAHVAQPPAPDTGIYVDQGYVDAHLTYAIQSPHSRFTIRTTVAPELKDYLKLAIRYLPPGEQGRAMVITSRSGVVHLNPAWYQAASGFIGLGIGHILSGFDHLLFLFCLIIPFPRLRQVVGIVTAFTVAHSFTLLGSAYGLAPSGDWFPPFVETAIAASIVYMALENIVGADLKRRWLLTGLFGLVHGFGFSYGLKENLQFAGQHLLVSLFAFNVGIEIGQVAVLAVMLPALALLRRYVLAGRTGVIILSALIAHTAWHWMIDRGDILWKTEWPRLDAASIAVLARWVAGVLLAAAAVRFIARRSGAFLSRKPVSERTS
ncbi:MAG TPA: HupE/UreJ family protein [Myxococcales bacterium]